MSVLSPKELRLFSRQIDCSDVGLENQNIIKQAKVAVVGLCGIGVTVSRLLCNTGYGKVVMIDQALVNEDSLASMTYLGWDDVGKHRCIAMREKLTLWHSDADEKVDIYNTLPTNINVEKLFAGCNAIVDTCRNRESTMSILDYADKHDVPVMISSGKGWVGLVGIYTGNDKQKVRERIERAYDNDELCMCRRFCFGFLNSAMGSITAGYLTRFLWGMEENKSQITEYDFRAGKIYGLLDDKML